VIVLSTLSPLLSTGSCFIFAFDFKLSANFESLFQESKASSNFLVNQSQPESKNQEKSGKIIYNVGRAVSLVTISSI
jgi:hypothetical protein